MIHLLYSRVIVRACVHLLVYKFIPVFLQLYNFFNDMINQVHLSSESGDDDQQNSLLSLLRMPSRPGKGNLCYILLILIWKLIII